MSNLNIKQSDLYSLWHGYSHSPVRVATDTGVHTPVVVHRTTQDYDSYGETVQGEVYMVFTVDGQAYKVNGYADSYGSVEWDGPVYKVKPTVKTIEVWE